MKWRGVLFLRFLLSLVDESEKIRQLADFLFGNILKGKNLHLDGYICSYIIHEYVCHWALTVVFLSTVKSPLLAYNSFVEAVFVLNDCHAHNGHRESHESRKESQSFSIR